MRLLISSSQREAPFSSAPKGCLRMASGPRRAAGSGGGAGAVTGPFIAPRVVRMPPGGGGAGFRFACKSRTRVRPVESLRQVCCKCPW